MKSPSQSAHLIVWGAVILVMAWIVMSFVNERASQEADAPAHNIEKKQALPVYKTLDPFTLTNQAGAEVTLEDYKGSIWVADVIFTRCPGPCAEMTRRMKSLQDVLAGQEDVRLVSLTTDPDFDTPEVMRRYALTFDANLDQWDFLTGPKPEMKKVLEKNLMQTGIEKDEEHRESENDLFIHSTMMVLIDKEGRIRGTFETLKPEALVQLLSAIELLKTE